MSDASFYWHDYETWGRYPALDKPAQFAGQRTDLDLNPVGEPLVIYCQPPADALPAPEACLITGITPQKAKAEGLTEKVFIDRIHAEMSLAGTCTAGYNSIRFDDEVTRYTLYRNFHDPYAREWQNGNSRWDLIDVARLCCALRPDGIQWPQREDGSPSFRLEDLSQANGLLHESAHDALSDVNATIGLARLLRDAQPRLFAYALEMRDKHRVRQALDVATGKPVLHVSGKFPASRYCSALMMPLAVNPGNSNAVICVDLMADPGPLLELDADAIAERVFTAQSELPADEARIPLKEIHINRAPMVVTPKLLDGAAQQRLQIDVDRCLQHREQILAAGSLQKKLADVYRRNYDDAADSEQALYQGFLGNRDRGLADKVRNATPEQLAEPWPFDDERLPELLFRYRARNFPASLTSEERAHWQQFCQQRLQQPVDNRALSLTAFRERLQALRAERDTERDLAILADLARWPAELGCE